MTALQVVILVCAVIWIIVKLVGKSKGQVRCNDCGHIGEVVPAKHHMDIPGTVQQNLVCAKCGSANWTQMTVVRAQLEEKHRADQAVLQERQRAESAAQQHLESRPHCQACKNRVEHSSQFCTTCGSREIVSHTDWLISPDKTTRQRILIGREIAQFRSMAQGMLHCAACDNFLEKTLNFCPKCGQKLAAVDNEYLVRKYSELYPEYISSESDLIEIERLRKESVQSESDSEGNS